MKQQHKSQDLRSIIRRRANLRHMRDWLWTGDWLPWVWATPVVRGTFWLLIAEAEKKEIV